MRNTIPYRHWQPGDDAAILELLSAEPVSVSRDYYEKKFNDGYLEPEGVRLPSDNIEVAVETRNCWVIPLLVFFYS